MKKRILCSVFAFLMFILCSCSHAVIANEPVTFYYPWADLLSVMKQNPDCNSIGSEDRDISGDRSSLSYVLSLYFLGPQDAALISPFPDGTSTISTQLNGSTLTLTLTPTFAQLKGIDRTIACTCLAKTCFDMTGVDIIVIEAAMADPLNAVHISITRDNYLLTDTTLETIPTTE